MKEESKPVYVIGHRNPDTDSICSAIGYAHLKQCMGENVKPARAGKINAETKFVLEQFGFDVPELITDLLPRVRDIMNSKIVGVRPNDTLRDLGRAMKHYGIKSVPVVDEKKMILGVVSAGDLAKLYFDELEMRDLGQAAVDFEGLMRALEGVLVHGRDLHRKIAGGVKIAAGTPATIAKFIKSGDVALVSDRADAQMACIACGVSCLVVTGNSDVDPEALRAAEQKGMIIIKARYDTYTCARLINQSVPVGTIMQNKVMCFKPTDLVSDIKKVIADTNYRMYPVVENERLVGSIFRDKLIVQERTKVILADHNESSQAVDGIEEAQIIEIIDHHRLGGLQTSEPIFIRHEPVGCTATIVANMHWHRGIEIPPKIAGLLLAAIVSDTVLFKSPTCTDRDRKTAEKLADIAGLNVQEFGMSVLKAGSSIKEMSTAEIISNDIKEFEIGEYRMAVGQISVMDAEEGLSIKNQLLQDMEVMRNKEKYDMVLLMVTDIITEGTHLVYTGQPERLLNKAFGSTGKNGVIYLPGVLSRKKQVIPPMIEAARL